MRKFSASDLVKKSASQILYLILKKIRLKPTPGQYNGEAYAEEIIKKEMASSEKRGIINLDNNCLIFFCVDLVKGNKYVEIKMVNDMKDYPEWYLHSSIMQATLYASLLQDVTFLDTPKFRKKEGYKQEVIPVAENPIFELWFGDHRYSIFPSNEVKQHYLNKAKLIDSCVDSTDYSKCREFDAKFKFKEFDTFKPLFKKIKKKLEVL